MRTGVTREQLRREVQIEAGLSTAVGHSIQHAERINHKLNQVERRLLTAHDWPPLTIEEEVSIAANAQFGALPPNITFTMISAVWCLLGNEWLKVTHGIGARERSSIGPLERSSPIVRWEIQYPGNTEYEVWPISAQVETLRFTGQRTVGMMDSDEDTCTLDADALVLVAAAEMIAKSSPEDAQLKLQTANAHIQRILNRQVGVKTADINLGRGPRERFLRPGIDFIPPVG